MKNSLRVLLILLGMYAKAQVVDPVGWEFDAAKNEKDAYEVKVTAIMEHPWHIYSQYTEDGGPLATEIVFGESGDFALLGRPREVGDLIEKYEEVFMVDTRYYEEEVTFVQKVKKLGDGPVTVTGSVTFMACTDQQCLVPETVEFEVLLD